MVGNMLINLTREEIGILFTKILTTVHPQAPIHKSLCFSFNNFVSSSMFHTDCRKQQSQMQHYLCSATKSISVQL